MKYLSFKYCRLTNSLVGNENGPISVYDEINKEILNLMRN